MTSRDELLSSSGVNRTQGSQELMVQILEAATQLFREKGFVGTTTQELADVVGLVKGTLYYHIGSKDELLYRIHKQVTDEGLQRWSEILNGDDGASHSELLEQLVVAHCRVIHEYQDWVAVFSEEMKFLPSEFAEKIRTERAEYQAIFEDVIRRGVEAGAFKQMNPRTVAQVALGMMNAMYRWYAPGGRLSPEEIGHLMASIIMNGVAE